LTGESELLKWIAEIGASNVEIVKVGLCLRVIRYIIGSTNTHEAVVVACFKGLRAACCYRTSSIHFTVNRITYWGAL